MGKNLKFYKGIMPILILGNDISGNIENSEKKNYLTHRLGAQMETKN
jgi:hypothetical protein